MSGAPAERAGLRRVVLVLAALRYLIPIAAIPAIPALIASDRLALLVLLRPTKEFLLLSGGVSRTTGDPTVALLFAAYAPLMIGGVWAFFALGRVYADELRDGDGPAWLDRMIDPDTLRITQRVLERKGPAIAILGRIAALPPTIVGAAAGTSDVDARRFLLADLVGALLAFGITVGAGMALGDAYERGGPWLTAAGVVLLVAMVVLLTRWIRREAARIDREHAEEAEGEAAAEAPAASDGTTEEAVREQPRDP